MREDLCLSVPRVPGWNEFPWGGGGWEGRRKGLQFGCQLLLSPAQFSKEKYILDSSPEKLHKELEEELKLSSTDLRSHAWYHGRIPREVSGP